jgi:hypothetical protein
MEFAYGHLLDIGPSGSTYYRFQNYALNQTVSGYTFLPFGFGGAIATLQGDNLDANLQFANTDITRNWVKQAFDQLWVARVTTVLWTPSTGAVQRTLYTYYGSCSNGGWNETTIQVNLNSVLDAIQSNVPGRRLHRWQVGSIPFTSQVRV